MEKGGDETQGTNPKNEAEEDKEEAERKKKGYNRNKRTTEKGKGQPQKQNPLMVRILLSGIFGSSLDTGIWVLELILKKFQN